MFGEVGFSQNLAAPVPFAVGSRKPLSDRPFHDRDVPRRDSVIPIPQHHFVAVAGNAFKQQGNIAGLLRESSAFECSIQQSMADFPVQVTCIAKRSQCCGWIVVQRGLNDRPDQPLNHRVRQQVGDGLTIRNDLPVEILNPASPAFAVLPQPDHLLAVIPLLWLIKQFQLTVLPLLSAKNASMLLIDRIWSTGHDQPQLFGKQFVGVLVSQLMDPLGGLVTVILVESVVNNDNAPLLQQIVQHGFGFLIDTTLLQTVSQLSLQIAAKVIGKRAFVPHDPEAV